MTDDEFDALKEAEKERLRLKKRAAALQRARGRSEASAGVLRTMRQRAKGLLDDTTALTQQVLRDVARGAARLEQALGDTRATEAAPPDAAPPDAASSDDPDAAFRAMQADALVRQMQQQDAASSPPSAPSEPSPAAPTGSDAPPAEADANPEADDDLPDKTIGRYR